MLLLSIMSIAETYTKTARNTIGITRREYVAQCGPHDAYYVEVPVVLTGDALHQLADMVGHPRPIWPPQLLHTVLWRAQFSEDQP